MLVLASESKSFWHTFALFYVTDDRVDERPERIESAPKCRRKLFADICVWHAGECSNGPLEAPPRPIVIPRGPPTFVCDEPRLPTRRTDFGFDTAT